MKPEFARAVDPIFEYVLGFLDRVEQGVEPDPQGTQAFLHTHLLNRAEQQLAYQGQEWRLAKFALVCWIDEVLTNAQWQGRDWWINNTLEFLLFQTADRAILFYTNAQLATSAATLDALEVYYLCVILGFRGIYERPEENVLDIANHGLPPTIDEWLRRNGESIRLSPIAPLSASGRQPLGAPPLGGLAFVTSALILFVVSAAVAISLLLVWVLRFLEASTSVP